MKKLLFCFITAVLILSGGIADAGMSISKKPKLAYPLYKLPKGLTFYKNYASGKGGQKTDVLKWFEYSKGSRTSVFTNTSSNTPVFDANGISMGTARTDVLKYQISGNRTAAQETIVIKFTPDTDFALDATQRWLDDTDPDRRRIRKLNGFQQVFFLPNETDSNACAPASIILPVAATTYVVTGVAYGPTETTNAIVYMNGVSQGADNDNYTTPAWGTYFYIGCRSNGTNQLIGSIAKVAYFNRALTASEVLSVTSIFNQ